MTVLDRQALTLEHELRSDDRGVTPQPHRGRTGVVCLPENLDVGMHITGDRLDDAELLARILEHPALFDVKLDPRGQVV